MKKNKFMKKPIIVIGATMIVPKFFEISTIALINKAIWKKLISIVLILSTSIVGFLYRIKAIKSKKEGGVARTRIFLIFIFLLCANVSILAMLYSFFVKILMTILGIMLVAGLVYLIYVIIRKLSNVKKKNEFACNYESLKNNKNLYLDCKYLNSIHNTNENLSIENHTKLAKPEIQNKNIVVLPDCVKPKFNTIQELWNQKDPNKKCITISNCENKDLKWVKIYKNRYGDGNFYGYVMMNNARETVNGIIYYSDRPIWYNV